MKTLGHSVKGASGSAMLKLVRDKIGGRHRLTVWCWEEDEEARLGVLVAVVVLVAVREDICAGRSEQIFDIRSRAGLSVATMRRFVQTMNRILGTMNGCVERIMSGYFGSELVVVVARGTACCSRDKECIVVSFKVSVVMSAAQTDALHE